jgi:lysozyme
VPAGVAASSVLSLFVWACTPQATEDVERWSAPLEVCAGPSTVPGIDVSFYQGAVDWGSVYGAGYRFAIARISDGLVHVDERFEGNWTAMQSAGVLRGAYQYFEPSEDARAQADLVVEKVGQLGPLDLPVALDAEISGAIDEDELVASYATWLDAVEAGTGKRPLLYTAPYFWNTLNDSTLGGLHLWAASAGRSCPELPTAWNRWSFWQSGTDAVPGISTVTDVDVFDGSLQELVTFVNGAGRDAAAERDGGAAFTSRPSPQREHAAAEPLDGSAGAERRGESAAWRARDGAAVDAGPSERGVGRDGKDGHDGIGVRDGSGVPDTGDTRAGGDDAAPGHADRAEPGTPEPPRLACGVRRARFGASGTNPAALAVLLLAARRLRRRPWPRSLARAPGAPRPGRTSSGSLRSSA